MKLDELLSKANDTITVRRVYGEPYEKDGLTVIPAAVVTGGGGGGSGHDEKGESGEGAGFGMAGRAAGATTEIGAVRQRRPRTGVRSTGSPPSGMTISARTPSRRTSRPGSSVCARATAASTTSSRSVVGAGSLRALVEVWNGA